MRSMIDVARGVLSELLTERDELHKLAQRQADGPGAAHFPETLRQYNHAADKCTGAAKVIEAMLAEMRGEVLPTRMARPE